MADVELPNPDDIEEQRKDTFTKMVALTVACYAVVLAVASLGGNNAGKETNLNKQEASNQWAYYQARVIREHEYRVAKSRLELDALTMTSEQKVRAEKLAKDYQEKIDDYAGSKEEIKTQAEKFEAASKLNQRKDPYFDYAQVLLQIAIVLASVSMLATSRPVYLFSILVALFGAFLTFNGFLLTVSVPFLEG